jgi:polyisoprenyl-phosphate glycosyltransferase
MLTDRSISIVVPCYNEHENIQALFERTVAVMKDVTPDWELVFIDNGSTDASAPMLAELAAHDSRVSVLSLSRNFGSQAAYSSGLEYARGNAVICMDGDLQDPPEVIPQLVSRWLEGYEVVYGDRARRNAGFAMRVANKAFYRLLRRFSYIDIPLDAGDFSLMDRRVVDVMNAMPERNRLIRGLRAWVGFRQVGVPYVRDARHAGRSSNSLVDLFRWASTGLVSYSYAPLELISLSAGVVMVLAAIAIVAYTTAYLIKPTAPPGMMTLLVAILFLGAVQLLCLSIISEYIAKIFEEVKARPKFIVGTVTKGTRGSMPGADD